MRLLTWNLQHGVGARRMPHLALALLEHAPDLVVLTEWRRAVGGQIAGVLADHGLTQQASSEPRERQNGILVAARTPLRVEPAPASIEHRLWLDLCLPEAGIWVTGVHVPCSGDERQEARRVRVLAALAELGRARAGLDHAILGDLNLGRHGIDEAGATFTGTAFLGRLATLGYVDAWRRMNPDGREYSWHDHDGAGFRIDHALLSPGLAPRLRSARYSHGERELGLSDHSVLVVDLARDQGTPGCTARSRRREGAPSDATVRPEIPVQNRVPAGGAT